jgi:hypothetical protein
VRPVRIFALATALLAATATATPAHAATRPRPVTLDIVSSFCDGYRWAVTFRVTTTSPRTVDLYDDSDYGSGLIVDTSGVVESAVAVNGSVTVTYHPGSSAQYAQIGAFPAGMGGWDGRSDPLASRTVRDPNQYGATLC